MTLLQDRLLTGLAQQLVQPELRACLAELQLPGPREERWRYSPLSALERLLGEAPASGAVDPAPVAELNVGHPPGSGGWPQWRPLQAADAAPVSPGLALRWLAQAAGGMQLSIADAGEGALLLQPLAGLSTQLPHRHLRLDIAAGQTLTVIEHIAQPAGGLANLLLQVSLGEGAQVQWLRLVEGPALHLVSRSEFRLGAGARLTHTALELSSRWSRHDLQVELAGAAAEVCSRGLLPLAAQRHADTQLELLHRVGDTRSDSLWRAVAGDRARAVFNGRIRIDAGADGSDAALQIGSLLLSDRGEIDAKPELEIHADAVKAAHGAAIGQLDPQALFYLRSRGLPLAQARALLMQAWCRETLTLLDEELQALVAERLAPTLALMASGEAP